MYIIINQSHIQGIHHGTESIFLVSVITDTDKQETKQHT